MENVKDMFKNATDKAYLTQPNVELNNLKTNYWIESQKK